MVKILLIAGHGAGDPGAVGSGTTEAAETRRVVNALVVPLRQNGLDVTVYDQNKNAFAELQAGRLSFGGSYDYVFEVHFNALNGTAKGTEAYITTDETGDDVEQLVVSNLGKYFTKRGVKQADFSVIWTAKKAGMSSCLYEMCFIDNAQDMASYNNNFNSIIQDIANGITAGFGLETGAEETNNNVKPEQKIELGVIGMFIYVTNKNMYGVWGNKRFHLNNNAKVGHFKNMVKDATGKACRQYTWAQGSEQVKTVESFTELQKTVG